MLCRTSNRPLPADRSCLGNQERLVKQFGFLIDMDGVLYRGPELIRGADVFIRELRDRNVPFRLLTILYALKSDTFSNV
jgi:Haloacid dehalogenase-like hydrolase